MMMTQNLKLLVDHFKTYFVFSQFKQFQVQLPPHPKQLPQVNVLYRRFLFLLHVKLCNHNSMFFSVTKWVWVKEKEWIRSLKAWNLAKDCRLTNSHNNVQAELLLDGTTSLQFLWTKALHVFRKCKRTRLFFSFRKHRSLPDSDNTGEL